MSRKPSTYSEDGFTDIDLNEEIFDPPDRNIIATLIWVIEISLKAFCWIIFRFHLEIMVFTVLLLWHLMAMEDLTMTAISRSEVHSLK